MRETNGKTRKSMGVAMGEAEEVFFNKLLLLGSHESCSRDLKR
jgi:hypothetical protein